MGPSKYDGWDWWIWSGKPSFTIHPTPMHHTHGSLTYPSLVFSVSCLTHLYQVSTTKGTGGDVLILEEAAYVDPSFFYETVAPLTIVGSTSLLAISTLTSEINFYTRLIRMKDKQTGKVGASIVYGVNV